MDLLANPALLHLGDAWLHDLSPFALRITDSFGIRWYGLSYALGFIAGYFQLRWLSRKGLVAIPPHRCLDAILTMVVGAVAGGRLGYVVFYDPSLLWQFSGNAPFWGVLAINQGGMASHGGIIGVMLASWRLSRGWKGPDGSVEGRATFLHTTDVMAMIAPVGLMFGRLANFINGELLGRIASRPGEPSPWWSVKFPQEVVSGQACFRTEAQQAALDDLVAREAMATGQMDASWDGVYEQLVAKIQAGGEEGTRVAEQLAPLLSARYPSQLAQATAEGVLLGLLLWTVWAKPRVSGVVGSWFLIGYGAMRIATEFVRLPDAGMSRIAGFSRGQWLSVGMVLGGAFLLVWVCRSGGDRRGGWWKGVPAGADSVSDPG